MFSFVGDICQFEDKCVENPCRYEGLCHRNYSDFNCQCREGFFGKRCQGGNWKILLTLQAPTPQNGETQTIRPLLPTNCFSKFDHFVELALKGLKISNELVKVFWVTFNSLTFGNTLRYYTRSVFRRRSQTFIVYGLDHIYDQWLLFLLKSL